MRLKKAAIWCFMMFIASGIPIFLAETYYSYDGSQDLRPSIEAGMILIEKQSGGFYENFIETLMGETKAAQRGDSQGKLGAASTPSAIRFNMAFLFSQDAKGPMDSLGGQVFSLLSEKDDNWMAEIYGLSAKSPADVAQRIGKTSEQIGGAESWGKVRISFYNGDGKPISGYSNVREVLSLASVYAYYHDIQDKETFLNYAQALWGNSHSYQISVSDFYYCDGSCLRKEGTEEEAFQADEIQAAVSWDVPSETSEAPTSQAETVSSQTVDEKQQDMSLQVQTEILEGPTAPESRPAEETEEETEEEPQESSQGEEFCRGHVDLHVSASITGMDGTNHLFARDTIGNNESNRTEAWQGWEEIRRREAKILEGQDWYALYGLTISDKKYIQNPLSDSEISYYMGLMPEETSEARRNVIFHALQSVGRIPYYWGGKPSCAGFEGNGFGEIVAPDTEGRVLRGLDCSGWVDWVYWTALGVPFHSGSTAGLIGRGQAIERSQLRPGDVILRTGESSHTFMFLAWTQDGGMYLIHETGNFINKVMIGRYQVDWPYYRNLIGD